MAFDRIVAPLQRAGFVVCALARVVHAKVQEICQAHEVIVQVSQKLFAVSYKFASQEFRRGRAACNLNRDGARSDVLRLFPMGIPVFSQPVTDFVSLMDLGKVGRSEVAICVEKTALTLEHLVVVKRYPPGSGDQAPDEIDRELELAAFLHHPSIVRTLRVEGVGSGACRHAVTEYLDGSTLHELLSSAAAQGWTIPSAAGKRILISLLNAAQRGLALPLSSATLRLCELPIAANDVFVTYDGRIKVLGFKTARCLEGEGSEPAVDALLSRHHTPGLTEVLARFANVELNREGVTAGWVASREYASGLVLEGRTELARVMQKVNAVKRARLAGRLVREFGRWRSQRGRAAASIQWKQRTATGCKRRLALEAEFSHQYSRSR